MRRKNYSQTCRTLVSFGSNPRGVSTPYLGGLVHLSVEQLNVPLDTRERSNSLTRVEGDRARRNQMQSPRHPTPVSQRIECLSERPSFGKLSIRTQRAAEGRVDSTGERASSWPQSYLTMCCARKVGNR